MKFHYISHLNPIDRGIHSTDPSHPIPPHPTPPHPTGPSGAGKSALLDILAQRKTVGRLEGRITYNANLLAHAGEMRQHSTYVLQEVLLRSAIWRLLRCWI